MKRSTLVVVLSVIGLLVFALARLALYIFYYNDFSTLTSMQLLNVFVQGARFDSSVLFIPLAPICLMLMLPIKNELWKKLWMWFAFILFVLCALMLAVDIIYYGHVKRHLANELYHLGNEIDFMIMTAKQYILAIVAVSASIIILAYLWSKFTKVKLVKERFIVPKILLLCGLSFLFIRGTVSAKPISTIDAFSYGSKQGTLILNGVMTTYRYGTHSGDTYKSYLPDDEAFKIVNLDETLEFPLKHKFEGSDKKKNVVVIILESWSAYYIGAYGSQFNVTPNFDKLSKKGALFMKHFSPQKRSIDGIQAILTGIPPMKGVPSLGFGLEVKLKGNIGEMADRNDFNTIFMQTSVRRSFYMDSIASSLGFKHYYGMEDYPLILKYDDPKASVFGWDYDGLNFFYNALKESSKPFIAVFFSGTTHTPFAKLPEPYNLYDGTDSDELGFLNTLYYADASLGEFMILAEKTEWFEDTIFIITADHTLGKFEKVSYPYDYHIPLLIYSPKNIKPFKYEHVTSHLDLLPTIIRLSSMSGEASSMGADILDDKSEHKAYLSMGDLSGLVTDDGWIMVAEDRVLEHSDLKPKELENTRLKLLAWQQIINKLLNENRWQ